MTCESKWLFNLAWMGQGPLKFHLFLWLLLERKILTWDVLVKKGWEGPGFCVLHRQNNESIEKLFVFFPFMKTVWKDFVSPKIKVLENCWCFGNSLEEILWLWI